MKKMILIAALFATSAAFAKNTGGSTSASYSTTSHSSGESEIDGSLGFAKGAMGLGVAYTRMLTPSGGVGGYFFYQTSKDRNSVPNVNQVMSFGGQAKIHLVEKEGFFDAYLAPGFGIHMIKDVLDSTNKKNDKTAFGPMLKVGGQFHLTSNMAVGIERMAIANWFDEDASQSYEFWVATFTIAL